MAKDKKQAEEKKEDKTLDGIFEIENGYFIMVDGKRTDFITEPMSAFREAVKEYKIQKSL